MKIFFIQPFTKRSDIRLNIYQPGSVGGGCRGWGSCGGGDLAERRLGGRTKNWVGVAEEGVAAVQEMAGRLAEQ